MNYYDDLMQSLNEWQQRHQAQEITHNPHWQRFLEATTVLAAQCLARLERTTACLAHRQAQALVTEFLFNIPSGIIVQAQSEQSLTLPASSRFTIDSIEYHNTQAYHITPSTIADITVSDTYESTTVTLTIEHSVPLNQIILYINNHELRNLIYQYHAQQQLLITVNGKSCRVVLDPIKWLPSVMNMSDDSLQLFLYAAFQYKFSFIACEFTRCEPKILTLTIPKSGALTVHQGDLLLNCLALINCQSGRAIPQPSGPECPIQVARATDSCVAIQSVSAVNKHGQTRLLAAHEYWCHVQDEELYLRLTPVLEEQTLSCELMTCASNSTLNQLDIRQVCFSSQATLSVQLIQRPTPCWPIKLADYLPEYLALIRGSLSISVIQAVLSLLRSAPEFIDRFQLYECRPIQIWENGILKQVTQHRFVINHEAAPYAVFCHALSRLLTALEHRAQCLFEFNQGDNLYYG